VTSYIFVLYNSPSFATIKYFHYLSKFKTIIFTDNPFTQQSRFVSDDILCRVLVFVLRVYTTDSNFVWPFPPSWLRYVKFSRYNRPVVKQPKILSYFRVFLSVTDTKYRSFVRSVITVSGLCWLLTRWIFFPRIFRQPIAANISYCPILIRGHRCMLLFAHIRWRLSVNVL